MKESKCIVKFLVLKSTSKAFLDMYQFKKHITLCNKLIKHVFNLSIDGNNTKRKIHVNSVALPLECQTQKVVGSVLAAGHTVILLQ